MKMITSLCLASDNWSHGGGCQNFAYASRTAAAAVRPPRLPP
jgi:hypothetical protein